MGKNRANTVREFGDFQTPSDLADHVCELCTRSNFSPAAVLEPTCGQGAFIAAALRAFPRCERFVGQDIDSEYVREARLSLSAETNVEIEQQDFFLSDWEQCISRLPKPILVIGNPPWVTNSELGSIGGKNVPSKSNVDKYRGLDAVTGKSNFDISESMLRRLLDAMDGGDGMLAMLCKSTVARKVLRYAWERELQLESAACYRIDATRYFRVAVDACLLVCRVATGRRSRVALSYGSLQAAHHQSRFGFHERRLLADVDAFRRHAHLKAAGSPYRWRSGVKHDCSRVMELTREGARYRNGLDEVIHLEDDFLYPMLKSSEVARRGACEAGRWMLVPQSTIGEETSTIKTRAPKTWRYLQRHSDSLGKRRSAVYRNRPPFSVFGVGNYTFAPWKVVISGFYKRLDFKVVGPITGKPVVLDDTSYFLPCRTRNEATTLQSLLNSGAAREYLESFIFWDAKRPITVTVLKELNLLALADMLGVDIRVQVDRNPYCQS